MSLTEIFYEVLNKEDGESRIIEAMEAANKAFSQILVPDTEEEIVGRRIEGDINGKLFFQPFSH